MRIAAVQHDIVWEDAAATRARLEPWIATAAGTGARLIGLTEMFPTGFSMATERTAEPPDGPTATWMVEQAQRHDVWLAGSIAERAVEGERPSNTLHLVSPHGAVHRYAKIHPFTYSGEHEHFAAGRDTLTVEVEGVRVTPFVCYDLRFANVFWDAATDTDAYLVVANWPAARRDHWRALLDARAIENQAYVVGVNRVGEGGNGLAYAGDSRIIAPDGELLASAARAETILLADLEPTAVARVRDDYPFLRDRR
jgi:predicted amidohydrolase